MLFTANRKPPRDGRWLAIRVEKMKLRLKPSRSDPASCTGSLRSDALALCLPTIRVGNRARYLQDAVMGADSPRRVMAFSSSFSPLGEIAQCLRIIFGIICAFT